VENSERREFPAGNVVARFGHSEHLEQAAIPVVAAVTGAPCKGDDPLPHAIVAGRRLLRVSPPTSRPLVDASGVRRPEPTPRKQISVKSLLRVSDRKCAWMLHWFQALLPRDDRFFELFAAHSHAIVAGAQGLRALLEGDDSVPKYYRVVTEREHDADNATRDILIAVRRSFITPFDRGAIKDLITAMDDSIDQMLNTAKAVMLFDIRSFTPEMKEIGDAVVRCALLVEEAIPLLRSISEEAGADQCHHRTDWADRGTCRRSS
jgi:uncharacterized protein Yka (UPF0111/DUF47 family)